MLALTFRTVGVICLAAIAIGRALVVVLQEQVFPQIKAVHYCMRQSLQAAPTAGMTMYNGTAMAKQ